MKNFKGITLFILCLTIVWASCNRKTKHGYIPTETNCEVNNTGNGCFTNSTSKDIVIIVADKERTILAHKMDCIMGIPVGSNHWAARHIKGKGKWSGNIDIRQCTETPIMLY